MSDVEETGNRKIPGEKPYGVVEKPSKKPNSATRRGLGARAFFGKLTGDSLYPEEGKQSGLTTKESEIGTKIESS